MSALGLPDPNQTWRRDRFGRASFRRTNVEKRMNSYYFERALSLWARRTPEKARSFAACFVICALAPTGKFQSQRTSPKCTGYRVSDVCICASPLLTSEANTLEENRAKRQIIFLIRRKKTSRATLLAWAGGGILLVHYNLKQRTTCLM